MPLRPARPSRCIAAVAIAATAIAATLLGVAAPAAAVFPAPSEGDAVYVKGGEIWRGSWPDGAIVERRLTWSGGTAASPTWSPDGALIAYTARGRLRVMRADGSGKRTVVESGAIDPAWLPWSSGRRRLGFVLDNGTGRFSGEIYSINMDGSDRRRVTWDGAGECGNSSPDWSADGRWLTYSHGRWDGSYCRQEQVLRDRSAGRSHVLPPLTGPYSTDALRHGPGTFDASSTLIGRRAYERFCFEYWATYNISSGAVALLQEHSSCDLAPERRELYWTPAGGLFEVKEYFDGDGNTLYIIYSYSGGSVLVSDELALDERRADFDIQPVPARAEQPTSDP